MDRLLLYSHLFTPGVPHAAHCGLADFALARADAAAAHLDHREQFRCGERRPLDEARGGTVLHRHEASGADEIGLTQPHFGHLWAVVLKAEGRPDELGPPRALWHDPAHSEAIADLLQHEAWKHGDDLHTAAITKFIHRLQQFRRLELQPFLGRAHAGLFVFAPTAVGRHGETGMPASAIVDDNGTF